MKANGHGGDIYAAARELRRGDGAGLEHRVADELLIAHHLQEHSGGGHESERQRFEQRAAQIQPELDIRVPPRQLGPDGST